MSEVRITTFELALTKALECAEAAGASGSTEVIVAEAARATAWATIAIALRGSS